jgi:hypothetical protein
MSSVRFLSVLAASILAASSFANCSLSAESSTKSKSLVKLYGQVDVVNSACGAAGVSLSSKAFPCFIQDIRLGSSAAYSGLQKNDKVLKASIEDNKLSILIERGGKQYGVKLNTARDPIIKQVAATDKSGPIKVDAGGTIAALREISKYDIILIVDRSGSMSSPSGDSEGLSNWDWCSKRVSSFARDISPYLKNNKFELMFFDNEFTSLNNASPQSVANLFTDLHPRGGTIMAPPIESALKEFNGGLARPLLVIVLTDGQPGDARAVESALIAVTKRMSRPDQLKVRFLEIGSLYNGGAFLELLDNHLVEQGAYHDVVDYASFEEVDAMGLAQAMVGQVSPVKPKRHATTGDQGLMNQLDTLRKEIEEVRQEQSNRNRQVGGQRR